LLNRLRCYTLPGGTMPVVRELADRLTPFARSSDPAVILDALRGFEREFIVLGGGPDPELTDAVAMVESAFPSTRLIEVRILPEI
jgi:hypothetical protein